MLVPICAKLGETGLRTGAIEIKSGATVASDFMPPLHRVARLVPEVSWKAVVYGGEHPQSRSDCEIVPLGGLIPLLQQWDVAEHGIRLKRRYPKFVAMIFGAREVAPCLPIAYSGRHGFCIGNK